MDTPDLASVQSDKVYTAKTTATPKQGAAPVETFIFITLFVIVALLGMTFAVELSPLLNENNSTDKTTSDTQITQTK